MVLSELHIVTIKDDKMIWVFTVISVLVAIYYQRGERIKLNARIAEEDRLYKKFLNEKRNQEILDEYEKDLEFHQYLVLRRNETNWH